MKQFDKMFEKELCEVPLEVEPKLESRDTEVSSDKRGKEIDTHRTCFIHRYTNDN